MKAIRALALGLLVLPAACMQANTAGTPVSASFLPAMRWDAHRPEAGDWTRALLGALRDEGAVLASTVPSDVDTFCPGYADAAPQERVAFWAGLFSVLAKHESTFNPKARGGGGQWIVQGPIVVEAASRLGLGQPEAIMAIAYGDQWTNLLQPFWALPLLAITGLEARQLIGYTIPVLFTTGLVFGVALLL